MKILINGALAAVLFCVPLFSIAQPLSEGNIVFQSSNTLQEYTRDGQLVQSFVIPKPTNDGRWASGTEYARDIFVLNRSYILVYNGTFEPYLSILDLTTETWTHRRNPGMWTINNGTYGGIAANDDYAFVSSMGPDYNNGNGFVRYDLDSMGSQAAGLGIGAIDLNLGLDGKLYVLYPGGSPGGRFLLVYDPATMQQVGYISLADIFGHTAHRAVAVNATGEIFIADWDGDIQKIDRDGNVLAQTNVCGYLSSCSQYDIDVDEEGTVITTARFGEIFFMDSNLENLTYFDAGYSGGFASFVGYSLIPVTINVDELLNLDSCVEAEGPNGTLVDFSLQNNNPEPVQYSWISSTGVQGAEDRFQALIGVGETASIYASITEPVSGNVQDTEIDVCVSDTLSPDLEIISPQTGDLIRNGLIDLDVVITDLVDLEIDSYDVFLGRSLTLDYLSGPRRFNIDLNHAGPNGNELLDITVTAKDATGNSTSETVQVELQGMNDEAP